MATLTDEKVDMKQCDDDFAKCTSCINIKHILNEYQKLISSKTNEFDALVVNNLFNESYSMLQLINDFNHIKYNHSVHENPMQFDSFYKYITNYIEDDYIQYSFCNIRNCKSIIRYYERNRNKSMIHPIQSDDTNNIYCIKLLSRIHTYFIHSLETIRLSANEIEYIEQQTSDIKNDENDMNDTQLQLIHQIMQNKKQKLLSIINTTNEIQS
eukprot:141622_1